VGDVCALVLKDVPVSSLYTQAFTIDIRRNDGYFRSATRDLSGLAAIRGTVDISKPFDAADWAGSMKVHLGGDYFSNPEAWEGEGDCSLDHYMLWDDDKLYIAAVTKDDIHNVMTGTNWGNAWSSDSIQLSFDATRSAGYAADKAHIRLTGGLNRNGQFGLANETSLYNGYTPSRFDLNFYRDEENKTTYYLLGIPWPAILPAGASPQIGKTNMGYTMLVNDADAGGRKGWIMYMDGIGTGKNPALFGDLVLANASGGAAPGDKAQLLALIAKAEKVVPGAFTAPTAAAFTSALAAAKSVAANTQAVQGDIDAARGGLAAAMDGSRLTRRTRRWRPWQSFWA
jgi:hypothetical protein